MVHAMMLPELVTSTPILSISALPMLLASLVVCLRGYCHIKIWGSAIRTKLTAKVYNSLQSQKQKTEEFPLINVKPKPL